MVTQSTRVYLEFEPLHLVLHFIIHAWWYRIGGGELTLRDSKKAQIQRGD
jgi:hypothetical protein